VGDLIGNVVDSELYFVPREEFQRIASATNDRLGAASLWADMARLNTLYMIARAGSGHIGSSFSSLDILSYLHLAEMREGQDVFFSSKGHDAPALYAILIALGVLPEEQIHQLRRLGGLPGHPDIATKGLVTNTGSLGMGISKAKGMIYARRLRSETGRIFVMTGDGELQEGQIWESLISAANDRLHELTAIVDHNKFQSDLSVERTSSLGDLEAKFRAFGWDVSRVDGHDPAALAACFMRLRGVTDRPKAVIADTVKGKGVSFMEGTAIDSDVELFKYHSGAPQAHEYQRAVEELESRIAHRLSQAGLAPVSIRTVGKPPPASPAPAAVRLIPAYADALLAAAERHPDLVALDADLALDMGLLSFKERYPDRFVECGIAEQDMVSQAGGMALRGLLPVVHSFSCFLATRPNEQIYNNATEGTRIVYVGGLSGVVPAGPGHSHQGVREISALGGIPNLVMVEPCCPAEVEPLLRFCLEQHDGPSFLRLVSVPYETEANAAPSQRPQLGCGTLLRDGRDGVIIAAGLVAVAQSWPFPG
jgi:transketolase